MKSSLTHLWLSAACAACVVLLVLLVLLVFIEIIFFRLYQKDKSSDSKINLRQASNCCKMALEAAKVAYANETKESITSQKLGSQER